jgi:hypothetical protein
MSDPDIDLEDRNPLGGIDLLTTGVGMAVIAVFPTFLASIFTPWKLIPMLGEDVPEGREGMLLAPGAYFVLMLAATMIFVGLTATDDTVARDGSLIGPGLARSISDAATEGNVWKTLLRIAPIFVFALGLGTIGRLFTRWVGPWWTLRTSVRTSFYIVATFISFVILLGAVFEWVVATSNGAISIASLYTYSGVPILVLPFWIYTALLKFGGNISWLRSIIIAVMTLVILIASFSALMALAYGT